MIAIVLLWIATLRSNPLRTMTVEGGSKEQVLQSLICDKHAGSRKGCGRHGRVHI